MKNIVMIAALPVLDGSRCSIVSCGNEKQAMPVESFEYFPKDFFEKTFVGFGLISSDPFVVADVLYRHLLSAGITVEVRPTPASFVFQFETSDSDAVNQ